MALDLTALDSYDFELPEELIAQKPAEPRDASRLLVLHREDGRIEHRAFSDLPVFLSSNDVLIANNTKVFRARLLGRRLLGEPGQETEGGRVEFLMLEQLGPLWWQGAFHASAKHRPGVRFRIPTPDGGGVHGTLAHGASESEHGLVVVDFDRDPIQAGAGEVPLPPYIRRSKVGSLPEDESRYQTLYAKQLGSAAAPTAGFHFTEGLLKTLKTQGVGWEEVTLHVGLGTFRPVKAEDVREHVMHEERIEVEPAAADRITQARKAGRRLIAVGTTSVRTLESAWCWPEGNPNGYLQPGVRKTSLFLRPGVPHSWAIGGMVTNFHLPRSTLLMLVCAFAGHEYVMNAYREAVRERYRFFSYGDAMLLV